MLGLDPASDSGSRTRRNHVLPNYRRWLQSKKWTWISQHHEETMRRIFEWFAGIILANYLHNIRCKMTGSNNTRCRGGKASEETLQWSKTTHPHENPLRKLPGGGMSPPRYRVFGSFNQHRRHKTITDPSGKTHLETHPSER